MLHNLTFSTCSCFNVTKFFGLGLGPNWQFFLLTHLGHQYGFQHDCCTILLWSSFCIIFVTFENIVNNSTVLVLVAERRKMCKIVSATDKVIIVCVCTQKSTGCIQPWRVSSLLVMAATPRLVASKFKVQLRC